MKEGAGKAEKAVCSSSSEEQQTQGLHLGMLSSLGRAERVRQILTSDGSLAPSLGLQVYSCS
jgi:hypothetical protein